MKNSTNFVVLNLCLADLLMMAKVELSTKFFNIFKYLDIETHKYP